MKVEKKGFWKMMAVFLSLALLLSMFVPVLVAEGTEDGSAGSAQVRNINLNYKNHIAGISKPTKPANWDAPWVGSKVRFGRYKGESVLFRVLDPDTTAYSSDGKTHTMFLDSDTCFEGITFCDLNNKTSPVYSTSNIKAWMNSDAAQSEVCNIVQNGIDDASQLSDKLPGFLHQFNNAEKSAIVKSYNTSSTELKYDSYTYSACNLDGTDRVFALDAKEATCGDYGYNYDNNSHNNSVAARKKKHLHKVDNDAYDKSNDYDGWWLRSVKQSDALGCITEYGSLYYSEVTAMSSSTPTASPALNLNLDSVLFATEQGFDRTGAFALATEPGAGTTEWNLTIKGDADFNASAVVGSNETTVQPAGDSGGGYLGNVKSDDTIKINVASSPKARGAATPAGSQVSAMVVDKNGTVLAYGKVGEANAQELNIKLPSGLEDIGDGCELYVFNEEFLDSAGKGSSVTSKVASFHMYPDPNAPAPTEPPTDSTEPATGSTEPATGSTEPAKPVTDSTKPSTVGLSSTLKSGGSRVPKTGDDFGFVCLATVFVLSGAGLLVVAYSRRRKREK